MDWRSALCAPSEVGRACLAESASWWVAPEGVWWCGCVLVGGAACWKIDSRSCSVMSIQLSSAKHNWVEVSFSHLGGVPHVPLIPRGIVVSSLGSSSRLYGKCLGTSKNCVSSSLGFGK